MLKKRTPSWREAHFYRSENVKNTWVRTFFSRFDDDSMWRTCTPFWLEARLEVSNYNNYNNNYYYDDDDDHDDDYNY